MKKYEVLKAVVILQAVCMIALSIIVIVKLWPDGAPAPGANTEIEDDNDANAIDAGRGQTAATVGDELITAGELSDKLHELYGNSVLRTMMLHKAIDLEAKKAGLTVSSLEIQRELEMMIDGYESEEQFFQFMSKQLGLTKDQVLEDTRYKLLLEKIAIIPVEISDREVDAYIEEHAEQYAPRLQLHLQWIVTESRELADEVLGLLGAGEHFDALARAYSIDEYTANSGGDLGFIDSDDPFYDNDVLDTASRLQVAEMAGPIQIADGYAVIQLVERKLTTGLSGRRLTEEIRKQLALEQAKPLSEIEEELLLKYDAKKKG